MNNSALFVRQFENEMEEGRKEGREEGREEGRKMKLQTWFSDVLHEIPEALSKRTSLMHQTLDSI